MSFCCNSCCYFITRFQNYLTVSYSEKNFKPALLFFQAVTLHLQLTSDRENTIHNSNAQKQNAAKQYIKYFHALKIEYELHNTY